MKIIFIAEIGINHNGDIDIAKQLISLAKETGFTAVKFQKRNPDKCVPESKKNVMKETPWGDMTYLDYKKRLEFGKPEYDEIDKYCKKEEIEWFASAWDYDSIEFLKQYGCLYNKVPSAFITNRKYLETIAKQGKYTFISTGMCTLKDIDKAVSIFKNYDCPFCLMHSVAIYPTPQPLCNIKMIVTLQTRYKCDVGYSGHEEGLLPSVVAAFYDICAIERHITLNRAMWGTDQSSSLEKRGQELLIRDVNDVKVIMGDGVKVFHESEKKKAGMLRIENDSV